ncbi:imidazolonepropionase [Arthrobacter sp. MYb211]|uniref:imidazolonepropionase n=1 Tax=Micrococcaceae TaxID=1268 RepID=UPI000CFBF622|nr:MULTISPECIES: imidazolonepropionase [unclassified Arthrobacter]PRA13404.1 imidazolonepropionase [Arthrobacter sp. MYb221]PRC10601.1 imidazolonepropionase [Arthrobacter sp. MYb211]
MNTHLLTNISQLCTVDREGTVLSNAAVLIRDGIIDWVGAAQQAPSAEKVTDLDGRAVLPGWVDSHSHLIFAGDRADEFVARMAGEDYAAGGIAVTTTATRATDDQALRELVSARRAEALAMGTTWMETKTGYGLTLDEEVRHARLARELVDQVTFLGAHLVPAGRDADEYTAEVAGPMLDAVAGTVDFVDVFCERGAFSEAQSRKVLQAAKDRGLATKIHGNQLGPGAGTRLAVEFGSLSVDHVNYLELGDIDALAGTWSAWNARQRTGDRGVVATCLPACDLSTRQPLAPGRELLDAGVVIALASNCNPGTSYTSNMNFCVATAVLQMNLSLAEAIEAATMGGAMALGVADKVGSIEVGKRADLHVLQAPTAAHLAYRPGMPLTHSVYRAGELVSGRG